MLIREFRYRPEIDGLRAFAVGAVVLYHAGLGFPGGFAGVDVFFVISGYLITSLIVRDLEAKTFSMARFWQRRFQPLVWQRAKRTRRKRPSRPLPATQARDLRPSW
jgi:peptidoglycan/LPS O-acetylase OafA/YrhL